MSHGCLAVSVPAYQAAPECGFVVGVIVGTRERLWAGMSRLRSTSKRIAAAVGDAGLERA